MDADGVARDTDATLQRWLNLANDELAAGRTDEAKKLLTAAQRDLRAIKAEVLAEERAAQKRTKAHQTKAEAKRFQIMKDAIDHAVHQLDAVKLDIEAGKYDELASSAPLSVIAPPPAPPPMWAADPLGRFELRYWDGERWTEHVSTSGQQQLDSDVSS